MKRLNLNLKFHVIVHVGGALIGLLSNMAQAQADVDTREGSYTATWQDNLGELNRTPLVVERRYRSRSHYRGAFGFRWCSSLDHYLVPANEFQSSSCQDEIKQLDTISTLSFQRATPSLLILTDLTGHQIRIHVDPVTALITSIETQDGATHHYFYKNNQLSRVVDDSKSTPGETFKYDLSHNLVEYKLGEKTQYRIDYDLLYDRVLAIEDNRGCRDEFSYATTTDRRIELRNLSTLYQRKCAGQFLLKKKFEFVEQTSPDSGLLRLRKVKIVDTLGQQSEVKFD